MTETYGIWRVCWLNAHSLEQESNRRCSLALTLTEGIHELLQIGSSLDLEENLVVVIRDFDVEVLIGRWLLWFAACRARRVTTAHVYALSCERFVTGPANRWISPGSV